MNRRRGLSDEDEVLWSGFARSITPLRVLRQTNKSQSAPPADKSAPKPVKASTARLDAPPLKKPPPLAPLDRRLKQRVARGRDPIDARIDLHGMTQSEAYRSLLGFLQRAQADGAKLVLVVTGKGESQQRRDREFERGVLKRQVPHWLSSPEFRSLVLGFDDAHVGHGGQGALYVRLRRPR
jgi:DNA-nicking Smr family endonuclease